MEKEKETKKKPEVVSKKNTSHQHFYNSVMKICDKENLSSGDLREIFETGFEFFKRKRSGKNGGTI